MTGYTIVLICLSILGGACIGLAMIVYRLQKSMRQNEHRFQTLRHEAALRTAPLEKQLYHLLPGQEVIVYDSRNGMKADDFTGAGAQAWDYVDHRFMQDTGRGNHYIENNILTINRTNTTGRYELYLKRFVFDGAEWNHVPAINTRETRTLRASCEVKKESASHLLRFVFKGNVSKEVLAEKDYVVFNPGWEKLELFFTIAANEDAIFRIDDLSVMNVPSGIQLKNLVLVEKR